jgi:hypothetical protein
VLKETEIQQSTGTNEEAVGNENAKHTLNEMLY